MFRVLRVLREVPSPISVRDFSEFYSPNISFDDTDNEVDQGFNINYKEWKEI